MKIGKDLLIEDKFFENTVISKRKGEEFYASSPNPILKRYIDEFEYIEADSEQIQKLVNYTVVRYLKTDKDKNLRDNVKRWKYANQTVKEYTSQFPNHNVNLNPFNRMKEELITQLFG